MLLSATVAALPAMAQDAEEQVSVTDFLQGSSVLFGFLTENATAAAVRLHQLAAHIDTFPADVSVFLQALDASGFDLTATLLRALGWLVFGAVVEALFRFSTRRIVAGKASSLIAYHTVSTIRDFVGLVIFAAAGGWPLLMSVQGDPVGQTLIVTYLVALLCIRLLALVLRIALAPQATDMRIVSLEDDEARRLYRDVLITGSLAMVFAVTTLLLRDGGLSRDAELVFALVGRTLVAIFLVLACLRSRKAVARLLRHGPNGRLRAQGWRSFSSIWHNVIIFYVGLSWSGASVMLLLDRPQAGLYAIASFLILVMLVVVCLLLDDWAASADARDRQRELDRLADFQDGNPVSQIVTLPDTPSYSQFFARLGQSAATLGALLLQVRLWSGPWAGLRASDKASVVLPAIVQLFVAIAVAYVLWHLVVISSERMLVRAATPRNGALEVVPVRHERVVTLLPLIRNTMLAMIATIAILIGLSAIGVDVVPLLAGAGVLGLAIGMGSQALVRDVISGVFFLLDDAFRIGEYVDVGFASGTVERAGVRSLQIRSHLGLLHTVPFGDIRTIANRSRDWVAMQLDYRIPLTVEPDVLRDRFDAIGQALLADEIHGRKFIGLPDYGGIISVEDNAMNVRVIFKCIPGEQFVLRDVVNARVRAELQWADIPFAPRTIHLHGDARPSGQNADASALKRGVQA
jgi:small-conductance mechanosensitive channel